MGAGGVNTPSGSPFGAGAPRAADPTHPGGRTAHGDADEARKGGSRDDGDAARAKRQEFAARGAQVRVGIARRSAAGEDRESATRPHAADGARPVETPSPRNARNNDTAARLFDLAHPKADSRTDGGRPPTKHGTQPASATTPPPGSPAPSAKSTNLPPPQQPGTDVNAATTPRARMSQTSHTVHGNETTPANSPITKSPVASAPVTSLQVTSAPIANRSTAPAPPAPHVARNVADPVPHSSIETKSHRLDRTNGSPLTADNQLPRAVSPTTSDQSFTGQTLRQTELRQTDAKPANRIVSSGEPASPSSSRQEAPFSFPKAKETPEAPHLTRSTDTSLLSRPTRTTHGGDDKDFFRQPPPKVVGANQGVAESTFDRRGVIVTSERVVRQFDAALSSSRLSALRLLNGEVASHDLPPQIRRALVNAAVTLSATPGVDHLARLTRAPAATTNPAAPPTNFTAAPHNSNSVDVADAELADAFVRQAIISAADDAPRGTAIHGSATHGSAAFGRSSFADSSHAATPPRDVSVETQALTDEVVNSVRLAAHFAGLKEQGGAIVRQAEIMLTRAVIEGLGIAARGEPNQSRRTPGSSVAAPSPNPTPDKPILSATELLRDLRSGAFLPTHGADASFALTGRARVVSEMMELMRTLDSLHQLQKQQPQSRPVTASALAEGSAQLTSHADEPGATNGARFSGAPIDSAIGDTFELPTPMLPRNAANSELPRIMERLVGTDGVPRDDTGTPLFKAADGTPLKLDELVWLTTAGGTLASSISSAANDAVPLSPLLIYGFDAVYSLIGFDPRAMSAPGFLLVHTEINDSETPMLFGQIPYSEGWLRAMIERLKDAALATDNALGELLEESMMSGQLHQSILRGAVERGAIAPESFSLAPVTNAAAFA